MGVGLCRYIVHPSQQDNLTECERFGNGVKRSESVEAEERGVLSENVRDQPRVDQRVDEHTAVTHGPAAIE